MIVRKLSYALILVFGSSQVANAELIITFGSLSLTGDSSGFLPVYVSGDGEEVGITEFELQITPAPSTSVNVLQFDSTYSGTGSDPSFLADGSNNTAPYIFYGQSGDDPNPIGYNVTTSPTGTANDLFDGADSDLKNDVKVTSELLLADIPLKAFGPPPAGAMYSYLISLVPDSGTSAGPGQTDNTAFSDLAGDYVNFSSPSPGMVTVEAAPSATVPEPGTFGVLLTGAASMFWLKRRRNPPVMLAAS